MNTPQTPATHRPNSSPEEQSLADLTKQLTDQASRLAQQEIELAKAELAIKGKRLGLGAGAFGGAGAMAFYAFGALTAALILGLATALDESWLAALIVGVAYGAIAGVLALVGKKKVDEGTPPVPEQAIESTRADVQHTKQRAKEARQ